MPEATLHQDSNDFDIVASAAYGAGEVVQLPDGRAGVYTNDCASGRQGTPKTKGVFKFAKTANGFSFLRGGRAYWDHSANVMHFKKVNDRDFYVGRVWADAAQADAFVYVEINIDPKYDIDLLTDPALSVPTGTQAVGGFGFAKMVGGAQSIELTATNEAQCIDLLSVDRYSVLTPGIAEFVIRPALNGTSVTDFNIGVANGTSTTDADAITEHCFLHVDGGSTNINAQSKDGTTTVAATNTTASITAGSAVANRFESWIDYRDPSNVKIYIEGVRVLSGTAFKLNAATGPLGLLVHLEKTASTETARFVIDRACARYMQQAA